MASARAAARLFRFAVSKNDQRLDNRSNCQLKTHSNVREMGIPGENCRDAKLFHDGHRCKICERDAGLVLKLDAERFRSCKSLRCHPLQLNITILDCLIEKGHRLPGLTKGQTKEEQCQGFIQYIVCCVQMSALGTKTTIELGDGVVPCFTTVIQGQPAPGIYKELHVSYSSLSIP